MEELTCSLIETVNLWKMLKSAFDFVYKLPRAKHESYFKDVLLQESAFGENP